MANDSASPADSGRPNRSILKNPRPSMDVDAEMPAFRRGAANEVVGTGHTVAITGFERAMRR